MDLFPENDFGISSNWVLNGALVLICWVDYSMDRSINVLTHTVWEPYSFFEGKKGKHHLIWKKTEIAVNTRLLKLRNRVGN